MQMKCVMEGLQELQSGINAIRTEAEFQTPDKLNASPTALPFIEKLRTFHVTHLAKLKQLKVRLAFVDHF